MKSLVFDALDDAVECLEFGVLGSLGSDGLPRVDAPVESAEFVEYNLDALDFSRESVAEDFRLVSDSQSAQELPGAILVQLKLSGSY